MTRSLARLRRLFETLRHLRWRQMSNRIRRRLLRPSARTIRGAAVREVKEWVEPIAKPRHLGAGGRLRIFDISRDAWSPALWCDDSVPRLWLYHAHYCDDLAASDVPDDDKRRLMLAWIGANPPAAGAGWEPYPVSRRLVNWLKYSLSGGQLEPPVVDSIAAQADYLARDLEFHLLGNHLLANAKALLFAGLLVDTPSAGKWAREGERLLRRQLAEQVLPDGGHHELSPMYHAVVLEDLLDLVNLGAAVRPALAAWLRPVCASMLEWLRVMTHPDGKIAFFNDAAFNGCATTGQIGDYAKRLGIGPVSASVDGLHDLRDSGYLRMAAGPMCLFADLAPVGPAHLPGHAHADTLSVELSVDGQRVVVNSGTSTYEDSPERHRQRGTAAHNTIVVDGGNSSDVWSAFRVGRRARILGRRVGQSGETLWATASHDGYRLRAGVVHTRRIELAAGLVTILDALSGRGRHSVDWCLHFHPDIRVHETAPNVFVVSLPGEGVRLELRFDEKLDTRAEASTFHPGFGRRVPNTRLIATASLSLPCELSVTVRLVSQPHEQRSRT